MTILRNLIKISRLTGVPLMKCVRAHYVGFVAYEMGVPLDEACDISRQLVRRYQEKGADNHA